LGATSTAETDVTDKGETITISTVGSTSRGAYFKDIRFDDADIENY
jgi:hypothetical protein